MSLISLLEGKRTIISLGGTLSHVGCISQLPSGESTRIGFPSMRCFILLAIIIPCLSNDSPESKASKYSSRFNEGSIVKSLFRGHIHSIPPSILAFDSDANNC